MLPRSVGQPRVRIKSLMDTGTPSRGNTSAPLFLWACQRASRPNDEHLPSALRDDLLVLEPACAAPEFALVEDDEPAGVEAQCLAIAVELRQPLGDGVAAAVAPLLLPLLLPISTRSGGSPLSR